MTLPPPPQPESGAASIEAGAVGMSLLLERAFEHAVMPTALFDHEGKYLRVNAAFAALFRRELESFVGRSFVDLTHPDDRERDVQLLRDFASSGDSLMTVQKRYTRADGKVIFARTSVTVLQREAGRPSVYLSEVQDTSILHAQEETLQRQATLLDSVLSNIPIAIDIVSPDGGVMYVNAYAEALLGWSLQEMRETDVMAKMYPDPEYRARVYASMTDDSAEWRDWTVCTRDGRQLTMSWTNVRLADGRVIGMGTDVTAVRAAEDAEARNERQLQQAQKLESLGVLAGGIAHDFNNLLVGVLGNASLAEELLPPDSEAAQLVTEVRTAATRAAELTRQLLAYAGKGRFVVEPVDVSSLVREMASLIRAATNKQATLRQELATGLPAVEADATQLRQVVMNLITNASDAIADSSGVITLRTSLRQPDEAERNALVGGLSLPAGSYVCIEVSDSGTGMSPETLSRIFDPFFTTKRSGHGLGLAATLGIVRSHRGGISLRSAPGRGTSICIYLPALNRSARASLTPQTGEIRALRGSGEILLADDEPAVRQVAARALERSGFTVTQAVDGADALRRFEADADRWLAVVLDLTMPNMGGQDALLRMRARRAELPAVLCSGYASEQLDEKVTSLASMVFVQKPFTVTRLVAAVLEVLPTQ